MGQKEVDIKFVEMGYSDKPTIWIPDSDQSKEYLSYSEMLENHPEVADVGLPYSVRNG